MKMSDVLTLVIIFGAIGYGAYGTFTGTGLGGWLNHAQYATFGFYYGKLSIMLILCIVGMLAAIIIFIWRKVSGSRDDGERL